MWVTLDLSDKGWLSYWPGSKNINSEKFLLPPKHLHSSYHTNTGLLIPLIT